MPAKKKKASSSWSSGRAPAWVSERSRTSKSKTTRATPARAKSKKAAPRAKASVPVKRTTTRASKTAARKPAAAKTRKSTTRATPVRSSRTSSRTVYREPRAAYEIQRALLDVDEPVVAASGGAIVEVVEDPTAPASEATIAIAGVTPATLGPEPGLSEEPHVHEAELSKRPEDIPLILGGAVLAGSVFLPWYRVGTEGLTANGWATGVWGPLIFFLGVACVVLVLLRRFRVAVTLPFPESIVLEGMGWLATLTAILKARFRPSLGTQAMTTVPWVYVAVGAGIAVALLAGRVSGKTPFVAIPGWYRSRAGKIGAALLLVVIGAGAAFGVTNKFNLETAGRGTPVTGSTLSPQVVKGLPGCAKDFPVPTDFKPFNGIESRSALKTCVATYQTTHTTAEAANMLAQSFQQGGWTFTRGAAGQATTFQITKPKCGSATVIPSANKQVYAVINVSLCNK